MEDPYGLLPPDFDLAAAMKDLENYVNPPLVLEINERKKPKWVPTRRGRGYNYRSHLEAHISQGRKTGVLDMSMCATIRYCFADIYRIFQETGNRKNFLSYGFFINRILELHGKDTYAKEPVTPAVRTENWQLWFAYERWVQEQMETCDVPESSRISWDMYKRWRNST
jgi:hypothetical protein